MLMAARKGAISDKLTRKHVGVKLAGLCRDGGIGRHASFRYLWGKPRGGSSPLPGTNALSIDYFKQKDVAT